MTAYAPYVVEVAGMLGIDPRLLMATFMIESRVCFWLSLDICFDSHRMQTFLPTWFPHEQGDLASIGVANMDKPTFDEVERRHPSVFGGVTWRHLLSLDEAANVRLGILAMGYRLGDLAADLAPDIRGGTAGQYSRDELIDFGYRGEVEDMCAVGAGLSNMDEHGEQHLELFRGYWAKADQIICQSGVWVCG